MSDDNDSGSMSAALYARRQEDRYQELLRANDAKTAKIAASLLAVSVVFTAAVYTLFRLFL